VSAVNSAGEGSLKEQVAVMPNASSPDGGDNTMLYVSIGVVAVLAVAGVAFMMLRKKK
jgi:LPXTG-motif cell wall-anchored protein